jgi:hypothetical protein
MSRKGEMITLDDVLDFYLAATEDAGADALTETIAQYPQFESELRDFAEYRKNSKLSASRIYSADEEALVQARAVSVVQNVLYQRRTETKKPLKGANVTAIAAHTKQKSKVSTKKAGQKVIESRQRARRHFARAVLSAEIVHQLHGEPTFGRFKHQKILHLCEYVAQIQEIQGEYRRKAAGPLDTKLIRSVEAELNDQKWFETYSRTIGHGYRPLSQAGGHRKYFERWWLRKEPQINGIINMMRFWNTERCAILSTLYAAWNDLIIWGVEPTDEAILHEVLERWHESKKEIPEQRWRVAIAWMRRKGFKPTGFGRPTSERD